MRAIVCIKQVLDPLTPATALELDRAAVKIGGGAGSPPVINGFDEQALEAALLLRESLGDLEIVALSVGDRFNQQVMKRALEVGADDLVLVQDPALDTWDSRRVGAALAAAIRELGGADLVLCGRQASDWDNALVPFVLAEELGLPCLTLARRLAVEGNEVEVERVLADGTQLMRASLPALVTVTSELGPLRFPTVPARLAAARRQPRRLDAGALTVADVGPPPLVIADLAVPVTGRVCAFVEGADGAAAGVRLAETLIEAGAVRLGGGA